MQITTYFVYEATNILFTFENRGGALKQTENRYCKAARVVYISQTTYFVYEATNILFTFENRGGALKQTENRYCTPNSLLLDHRKNSGQSIFEDCVELPNFLLSSYGGVAVSISIFLKLEKNYNEQK